jgi:hypothetical protein
VVRRPDVEQQVGLAAVAQPPVFSAGDPGVLREQVQAWRRLHIKCNALLNDMDQQCVFWVNPEGNINGNQNSFNFGKQKECTLLEPEDFVKLS